MNCIQCVCLGKIGLNEVIKGVCLTDAIKPGCFEHIQPHSHLCFLVQQFLIYNALLLIVTSRKIALWQWIHMIETSKTQ